MAHYRVMAWRGIPSQVKATDESGAASRMLLNRWQQEIDRPSRVGYVGEWRRDHDQEVRSLGTIGSDRKGHRSLNLQRRLSP